MIISSNKNKFIFKSLIIFTTVFVMTFGAVSTKIAHAQQTRIDYGDQLIVDSDLDGLTDEGEKQMFKTDLAIPDTDGDGYLDGTEVVNGTDPNNTYIPLAKETTVITSQTAKVEPSWGWYVTRTAGLIGYLLLAVSIFLGAGIGIPGLRKWLAAFRGAQVHCWISLQALLFALIHGLALIFDKYLGFGLKDVFIPLTASFSPEMVALGTISFYIMLIIVISSYLRKRISLRMWRITHFLNLVLWVITIIHVLAIGTDMKIPAVRNTFIAVNIFLAALLIINLFFKGLYTIRRRYLIKTRENEDQSQSDSQIFNQ